MERIRVPIEGRNRKPDRTRMTQREYYDEMHSVRVHSAACLSHVHAAGRGQVKVLLA